MLFIITNSLDGTSDIIALLCERRKIPFFRFNVDFFQQYDFTWNSHGFSLTDPSGRRLISNQITACWWRKVFFNDQSWEHVSPEERRWVEAELNCIIRELANWCRHNQVLRLVDPAFDRKCGKIQQMRFAERHFHVPDWSVHWGKESIHGQRMVKNFASETTSDNRYIYVQEVNAAHLSLYHPWFLQNKADGEFDATVVYVTGQSFGFRLESTRDHSPQDWRVLINTAACRWIPWEMPHGVSQKIDSYMKEIGLLYGRLDFIAGNANPAFLEVNSNGQFGWLDFDTEAWTLHQIVLDAVLNPKTTIQ